MFLKILESGMDCAKSWGWTTYSVLIHGYELHTDRVGVDRSIYTTLANDHALDNVFRDIQIM